MNFVFRTLALTCITIIAYLFLSILCRIAKRPVEVEGKIGELAGGKGVGWGKVGERSLLSQ